MNQIVLDERDVTAELRPHAKQVGYKKFMVSLKVIEAKAPEMIADYVRLTRAEAKNPYLYRAAVEKAGSIDKVIIE